jgi:hypothetical protein
MSLKIKLRGKSRYVKHAESINLIPKSSLLIHLLDLEPLIQGSEQCKVLTYKVTKDVVLIKLNVGFKTSSKLFIGLQLL